MTEKDLPTAQLLTSTHCPHCHLMRDMLQQRVDQGHLGGLQVVNIEHSPELAQSLGVRSVPWLKIKELVFEGALSPAELDSWIAHVAAPDAMTHYLEYLLLNGGLSKAIAWLEQDRAGLAELLPLIVMEDVKLNVRIGIGALFEHFEGSDKLQAIQNELISMANNPDAAVRADVCHYLALTRSLDVLPMLEQLHSDPDRQVREIAAEGLQALQAGTSV